jgi:LPS export ABC transporter permease LptG
MRGVFLASNDADGSKVFFAASAHKLVDEQARLVTLLLRDGIWHRSDASEQGDYGVAPFAELRLNLQLDNPALRGEDVEKGNREMSLQELRDTEHKLRKELADGLVILEQTRLDATLADPIRLNKLRQIQGHLDFTRSRICRVQVERHKKYAIPFACIIFAVIGVPLGIRGTKSGRSAGFAISIGLFILYYVLLVGGEGLGNEGQMPAGLAIWGANLVFGLVGLALIWIVGRETQLRPLHWLGLLRHRLRRSGSGRPREAGPTGSIELPGIRLLAFPRILDLYIARDWIVIYLAVAVSITAICDIVELFEKLDDFNRNNASLGLVARYIAARTPAFAVITAHISSLVATVLTISGLNRRSELTAIRASGVRLVRLALPLMLLGLLSSAAVWFLNESIVPQTNRRANDILDYEIRGRLPTKLAFNRNWYRSSHDAVLYYTVRESMPEGRVALNRFTLFRLGPQGLPMLRVEAQRAVWEPAEQLWYYEGAVLRRFDHNGLFLEEERTPRIRAQLEARPADFEREISGSEEMNYWQLRDFIATVRSQGNDPTAYVVDLYGKVSFCLISFVMVLVGFPFAATSNRSGKLAWGIVISIVIGVTFFVAYRIGISLGHSDKLGPLAAAYLPLAVYAGLGFSLLLKME